MKILIAIILTALCFSKWSSANESISESSNIFFINGATIITNYTNIKPSKIYKKIIIKPEKYIKCTKNSVNCK